MKTLLVQFLHLNSQRVHNKMMRDLNGQPLVSYGLKLISQLKNCEKLIIATPEFKEITKNFNLDFKLSEGGYWWLDLIKPYLSYFNEFDQVIDVNFCCHPFLRLETAQKIINIPTNQITKVPLTFVKSKRGILYNDNCCILGNNQLADTKRNPRYYELLHFAYSYPQYTLEMSESEIANSLNTYPLAIHPEEEIDIDTESDLELANWVAKGKKC